MIGRTTLLRALAVLAVFSGVLVAAEVSFAPADFEDGQVVSAGAFNDLLNTNFKVAKEAIEANGAQLGALAAFDAALVAGACPQGSAMRAIGKEGSVSCEVDDAGGSGLALPYAGITSVGAGTAALAIEQSQEDGGPAIGVTSAGNGIDIDSAKGAGLALESVRGNGMVVNSATGNGLRVNSSGGSGVVVVESNANGMYIGKAGATGLSIGSSAFAGVFVARAGEPSSLQSSGFSDGFSVAGAEGYGLYVGRSERDAVFVWDAGGDGLTVFQAEGDGVDANSDSASAYGGRFVNRAAGGAGLYVSGQKNGAATFSNHVAQIENVSAASEGGPDVLALKTSVATPDAGTNFITFINATGAGLGEIEGDGAGGVRLASAGADFAEYLPKLDASEVLHPGDVVGLVGAGVTRDTQAAQRVMVVSTAPLVLGNRPVKGQEHAFVPVAFLGQAPVNVRGAVAAGDYLLASGQGDGSAIAAAPGALTADTFRLVVGQSLESSQAEGPKQVRAVVGLAQPGALATLLARKDEQIHGLEARLAAIEAALAGKAGQVQCP